MTGNKDDSKDADKSNVTKDNSSSDMAENSNANQGTSNDALDDSEFKGSTGSGANHGSAHGTRLTRSRANQGTPGPNDTGNDSPSMSLHLMRFNLNFIIYVLAHLDEHGHDQKKKKHKFWVLGIW